MRLVSQGLTAAAALFRHLTPPTGIAPATLAASLNPLGLNLLKHLSAASPDADVVISPVSLKTCLSMVGAGATEGSKAEQEIFDVIGGIDPLTLDPAVEIANSGWIRSGVKESYVKYIEEIYGANAYELAGVDPTPINQWVATNTHGRIERLFEEPLDPLTMVTLVNTVFFKGAWKDTFDAKNTKTSLFRAFDGQNLECDMMSKVDKRMSYFEDQALQAVQLPYVTGDLVATIILPKQEGPEALHASVEALTPAHWEEIASSLRVRNIQLMLPRFRIEFGTDLTGDLNALGMTTPFTGEPGGAFLKMSDDPTVHIGAVMHKAGIEVNEEGTVAHAATGAVMQTRSLPRPPTPMVVDRPFLFFISNHEGAILFAAKVTKPALQGIGSKLG